MKKTMIRTLLYHGDEEWMEQKMRQAFVQLSEAGGYMVETDRYEVELRPGDAWKGGALGGLTRRSNDRSKGDVEGVDGREVDVP